MTEILVGIGFFLFFLVIVSIGVTGRTFPWQSEYFNPNGKPKNKVIRFFRRFIKG